MHGIAAGASLTLALTHLLLAIRSQVASQRRTYVASTIMSASAAGAIYFELAKSLAPDVDSYLAALQGNIVCVFGMVMALLVFVRRYFQARANALFVLAIVLWVVSTGYSMIDFPTNFFSEVGELNALQTSWNETYVKLDATVTPEKWVTDVGTLLVIVFIAATAVDAWRREDRRPALIVGGSGVGFLLVAGILVPLDDQGLLRMSMPVGLPFLGIVAALTYQLIDDRLRANALRLELEQLRRRSLAGEIVAGLMHEIRQPLTSILSNSQAARRFLDADDPDLDEVREALDDVVAEDKRAADIVGGLRSFLGHESPEISEFDVNATVRRVANMLAGEFHTSNTRLALGLHQSPVRIVASEVQIEQVLINLTINALRALRNVAAHSRVVRVTTVRSDGSVELSVSDSGPGIAKGIEAELFEPFTSGGDGLGMGLAICKRIVTSYGGNIRAEGSELGGARFVITLPVSQERSPHE